MSVNDFGLCCMCAMYISISGLDKLTYVSVISYLAFYDFFHCISDPLGPGNSISRIISQGLLTHLRSLYRCFQVTVPVLGTHHLISWGGGLEKFRKKKFKVLQ